MNNAVKNLEDKGQEIYGIRDLLFPKLALNKVDKPHGWLVPLREIRLRTDCTMTVLDALKAIAQAMTTNKGRGADYVDRRDPVSSPSPNSANLPPLISAGDLL